MEQIIRHLFKADSLDDVPIQRLEELVEEHPSFSLGHYFLSRKLRSEQVERFSEQTQRTNLYFSNPFWLNWLLRDREEPKEWIFTERSGTNGTHEEPVILDYPAEAGSSEEVVVHPPLEELHFQEAVDTETARQPWEEPIQPEITAPPEPAPPPPAAPPIADEPLVFQSYHTIDYFASQGIRLSVDESQNPSDRLGRQLKSFTEWLKVMKKIPQKESGELAPDAINEQRIQAIAAHSIEDREVVTETMAEVLAKQGMWDKAAGVYQKLSLLNPDKSAYFATLAGQMHARANEQLNTN